MLCQRLISLALATLTFLQSDAEISNTIGCPTCGRRVAAHAPVCPRCEVRL